MIQQQTQSVGYFFTELSLICQLLSQELKKCKIQGALNILCFKMNQEGDICTMHIRVQQPKSKASTLIEINAQLTIIQIQTCIKFHVLYCRNQYTSKFQAQNQTQNPNAEHQHKLHMVENRMETVDQNEDNTKRQLKQSFQYLDEFWINIKNYLPKKIYQAYHLSDFQSKVNGEKLNKLKHIFTERIINQIVFLSQPGPDDHIEQQPKNVQIVKKDPKILLLTAVAQNYAKLSQLLKPKEYKNLCISNRQIYKVLTNQQNYKILFEQKWGRTGFELDERNWIKMYKNKVVEEYKKKNKSKMSDGFYWV